MISHKIETLDELKVLLSTYGEDALYRGQVKHYGPIDAPIMNSSFNRNGCIPDLMLRWAHYTGFILSALLGKPRRDITLEFSHAILQHYGWRSFYLDVSASPSVSAWFASHVFNSQRTLEVCEDCFEEGIFILKLKAQYTEANGVGCLYVLSKNILQKHGIGLIDLASIELTECRPRFHVQNAWMLGPLKKALPVESIVACIGAPAKVFRALAAEQGIIETSDLFPNIEEDPVLKLFTTLPWKKRSDLGDKLKGMNIYSQPIEFPEYHDSFHKIYHSSVAFQGIEYIARNMPNSDIAVFEVPEIVVFGHAEPIKSKFPKLRNILAGKEHHFVFEVPCLVRKPGLLTTEYLKGLAITKRENGLLDIADFAVEHPGCQLAGCGINKGWNYKITPDGKWERHPSPDDCTCDNESIHFHHLSMLTIIEDLLSDNSDSIVRRQCSNEGAVVS